MSSSKTHSYLAEVVLDAMKPEEKREYPMPDSMPVPMCRGKGKWITTFNDMLKYLNQDHALAMKWNALPEGAARTKVEAEIRVAHKNRIKYQDQFYKKVYTSLAY